MLALFRKAGEENSNNRKMQFWQQNNHPKEVSLIGNDIEKVIDYIHYNPVKAGFVIEPHDFLHSSARNYLGLDSVLKICSIYEGIEI